MPSKIILWLLLATALIAQSKLDTKVLQMVESIVTEAMSAGSIPGLAIAIAINGELVYSQAFGLQDLENSIPAKQTTAFRLASVSKPFTAALALSLAKAGRLDLDAPIQRYVPAFPLKEGTITPRLLLSHLAGIRHYRDYGEINSTRHFATLADALQLFQSDPLVAHPGARFAYSTFGYTLLGAVIETACGSGFGACLQEWVLAPANIHHITADDVSAIIPHRARGYGKDRSGKVINTDLIDTSNKIPGGGLLGTAQDLVRFALALNHGELLDANQKNEMWTSQQQTNGKSTGYGLGWSIMQDHPKVVGHSGGQTGATSILLIEPNRGNVVAILCNMEQAAGVGTAAENILDLIATSTP